MLYYKLKISLNYYEDRLNRTILFKSTNDLNELAFTILSIFNTTASHLYKFEDDENKFECEISLQEAEEMGYPDMGINTWLVTLEHLKMKDNTFIMTYDYGANYKFVIEIMEQIELKGNYSIARVIDGVGYGIVEDGKDILEDYLDGKELRYPLMFIKEGKPKKLDFNSFDVEKCNKKLKREISKIRNKYML